MWKKPRHWTLWNCRGRRGRDCPPGLSARSPLIPGRVVLVSKIHLECEDVTAEAARLERAEVRPPPQNNHITCWNEPSTVTTANRPPRSFKTRSASNRMTSSITSFRKLGRPIVNDVPA